MLPERNDKIARETIARRAALELRDGEVVNLGIGIPVLVSEHIPDEVRVMLHSENGAIGVGPAPDIADYTRIGAGGKPISIIPGGSFMSSELSFGMIRGGHIDATILGSLEVDETGSMANWMVPGKSLPGMGGAMDLVVGAKKVYIAMTHTSKDGSPKIVKRCTLPLTAVGVVTKIFTELAVFSFDDGLVLEETAPGVTPDDIRGVTGAEFRVSPSLCEMRTRAEDAHR